MPVIEGSIQRGAGVERGPGAAYYADANNGNNGNSGGSWGSAKATIAAALALMSEGDTLYLSGKFKEQVTLSNLHGGITIMGADDRLPAHADAPWPSGASWLPPDAPTAETPLLTIRSQGVTLKNILFDAPADAAAVKLERNALSGNNEYDASHAHIVNCRFTGGSIGIENAGGAGFVFVEDCRFYDLTSAIKCTSTAVAVPLRWVVQKNIFMMNTNHIQSGMSQGVIINNVFQGHTTDAIDLAENAGGGNNVVSRNVLGGTYSIAGGYIVAAASDEWAGNLNSLSGGVTADDPAS